MTRDEEIPEGLTPPFAEDALVIAFGDPEAVRAEVEAFRRRQLVTGGVGAVLRHVEQHQADGARLTPIYPERSLNEQVFEQEALVGESAWRVAVPDYESPRQALSAFHYLQLGSAGPESLVENAHLEAWLRSDPHIVLVYHPAIPYADDPVEEGGEDDRKRQWALERCGFPGAWPCLDQGFDPGPIGVIDEGGDIGHEELRDVVHDASAGTASDHPHASAVIGVLAALRDGKGMDGCCSAKVCLYSVSTSACPKPLAFMMALKAVACEGLRVVNVSLVMRADPLVREQIRECIEQGMIVVAAMGNQGSKTPSYPAGYDGVIAVGATGRDDDKLKLSNTGKHIWLSAPGERIYTIANSTQLDVKHSGTSYAAPMVSAAAWLALRARPYWSLEQVRDLLARSVHRVGKFDKQVGHGRLDMRRMLVELNC